MTDLATETLRVLRVYHSGVVSAWRARDRELRQLGDAMTLLCAARWNEGGADVVLTAGVDDFVEGVRTFGRHPNLFAYDPWHLWRALRAQDFDVIDIHEEPVSVAAAEVQLIAWLAGRRVPFCLYSAQNIEKRYPLPFRWIERVALRRATAVHTCNDAAGAILRRKGFSGFERNLGLGIDADRFAPAAARCTTRQVGYVGRLESHKGVQTLVDAVARIPGCRLRIVGDGPDRPAVEQRIRATGTEDRVVITGHVPHDRVPDEYRHLDVVAVPSLETPGWIEQFGRVAVEAMASGVPVVASRSGSLPEVVGDAGILVPPGDVGALTAALDGLLSDEGERTRLGALGRERSQRYSWPAIARAQHDLYREIVTRAG